MAEKQWIILSFDKILGNSLFVWFQIFVVVSTQINDLFLIEFWFNESARQGNEVYFLCLCVVFNWIQTQSEFVITRLTRIESLFIIFYELTQSWRFHIFRAAFWDDEWQVGGACSFSKMVVLRCLLRWDNVQRMWTVILNH